MAIVINGSGTVTGISVGGLPDDIVDAGTLADNAVGLAQMAGGTDGNIITYDTSGNPAVVATGSSGQILTSAGAGAVPTMAAGAAKVLQVQSFYHKTAFTNSNNQATAATGIKKAITPSATSSKILVLVNINGIKKDAATNWLQFDLKCGSHETKRIERHYGYYGWVSEQTAMGPIGFTYLSSPSTTSSIEYEVMMGVWDGTGTSEICLWSDSASSITLLEIGA